MIQGRLAGMIYVLIVWQVVITIMTYCNINAIMTSARRPVNISWFVKDMVQLPGD